MNAMEMVDGRTRQNRMHEVKLRGPLLVAVLALLVHAWCELASGEAPSPESRTRASTVAVAKTKGWQVHKITETTPRPGARGVVAGGGILPARNIAALADGADIIARGSVIDAAAVGDGVLTEGGLDFRVRVWVADCRIESVLKGTEFAVGSTVRVEFYAPDTVGRPWGRLDPGQHGLLFLTADGTVSDLYYPMLPVAPSTPAASPGLSPLAAIQQYLLESLEPDTTEPVLASCIQGTLEFKLNDAAERLARIASTAADPRIAGDALWGLVEFQDARAFPAAVEFVLRTPKGAEVQASKIVHAIAMLTDPRLALFVTPLLSAVDPDCRREGLCALRNMRAPDAVPLFVAALSDQDAENTYIAAMGLAETLGRETGEWAPSWDKFQENPSYYVDKWRNWWETEGKALYATSTQTSADSQTP